MFRPTRVVRALIAIALCVALVVSFIWNRNQTNAARDRLGMAVVSTSWKLSEMIYEGEQLSSAFAFYVHADLPIEDVQRQFDIFWSRITVLENLEMSREVEFAAVLGDFEPWLEKLDALIYAQTPPARASLVSAREELGTKIVKARRAWLTEYNTTSFDRLSPMTAEMSRQTRIFENTAAVILSCIILYLLVELYLSGTAMQREQELNEAAQAANRAKSQFIANVSHEIRTPLNGIMGTATLLSETALSREQKEYVNVLEQAGGLLLSTINDVLDFSKMEAGELAVQGEDFDAPALFKAVEGLYQPLAQSKSIGLVFDVDQDLRMLHGDGRRLRQVLHNLISNAIKFTDTGQVTVNVRLNATQGDVTEPALVISVSDTGIGIPADDVARVFEPFGQSDSNDTRRHGGTGLGLTISRNLCRAMGGDLTLDSAQGEGSTFCITVPFNPVQVVADSSLTRAHIAEELGAKLSGCSILIVDDTRTNRFILKKFLRDTECDLTEADCGQAAVDLARDTAYDAILMDVQMPGMDGVTATRNILSMYQSLQLPAPLIFGVTANALPHQVDTYKAAGMRAVLPKPVSKSALIGTLQDHLRPEPMRGDLLPRAG